jgi:cyclopropane-fatty-acyl-phospholipid synthase
VAHRELPSALVQSRGDRSPPGRRGDAAGELEQAQAAKVDLACRKLGLEPRMRLLDVGCDWGGMVLHATEHHGVRAAGVTLSRRQAEWAER